MSEQLALALKAGIPMVRVATDDEINATDILAALTDKEVDPWDGRTPATTRHGNKVVWIFGHNREAVDKISPEFYNQALNANMTFVLINGVEDDWSWALDCGVMSPPESMIADVLEQMLNPADAKKFARFFLGMSVKQVIETVMLTQARDKVVSAAGINQTKSYLGRGLPGLEAVDPKQDFYVAPPWADEWLEVEAPLIQKSKYRDLWPRGFMLHGPPGTGKCLAPDERVLLYNGHTRLNKDLRPGDRLMGPDGAPRTVLTVNTGHGPMFEVRPNKGRAWRCNGDHILSLRRSEEPGAGQILHVTVNKWLSWPAHKKSKYKQWRAAVDFPNVKTPMIDPYLIGVLLGDGSVSSKISVHTVEPELIAYLREQAYEHGMELREWHYPPRITEYGFVLPRGSGGSALRDMLRHYGLMRRCSEKLVPHFLKTGSRQTRLAILAGLMDTDGSYDKRGGVFDFISKSQRLSDDVVFMARSLGLAAYARPCEKTSQNGTTGTYYRVCISGDIDCIPVKIERKKPRPRQSPKNVSNVGFDIVPVGDGPWVGITIDGDRQFLLDDFTVTHNTELAKYIASKLSYPLFRLDAGSLYSRWQGDTEARLRNVLSFIDGQGECVFLIDEAEKLFGNEALGQASQSTMQGMLLWWLQSNSNKAVTVMTANSLETIPPALYREGRLDAVHKMEGVKKHLADIFAKKIVPSFAKYGVDPHSLSKAVGNRLSELANATFSQATVVGLVRAEAKRLLFQEPKEGK